MKTPANVLTTANKPVLNCSMVEIEILCRNATELNKAEEAVLYHLSSLKPEISKEDKSLKMSVVTIDPTLFRPGEACDIIYCTLEPKLDFVKEWKCTLHTINPKH